MSFILPTALTVLPTHIFQHNEGDSRTMMLPLLKIFLARREH